MHGTDLLHKKAEMGDFQHKSWLCVCRPRSRALGGPSPR